MNEIVIKEYDSVKICSEPDTEGNISAIVVSSNTKGILSGCTIKNSVEISSLNFYTQEERKGMREEIYQEFLDWRGIEKPCKVCGGSGVRAYGTTSTWIGGIGGATMTSGVCDSCWGSGDADKKGANLRKLYHQLKEKQ